MGITIGLYYNGARYLAAWLGRWTSADPIGIGADGPGLYNYTRGSPVNYTDPSGTDSSPAQIKQMESTLQVGRAVDEVRYQADMQVQAARQAAGAALLQSIKLNVDAAPIAKGRGGIYRDEALVVTPEQAHMQVQFVGMGEDPREARFATLGQIVANKVYEDIDPNASDFGALARHGAGHAINKSMGGARAAGPHASEPSDVPRASIQAVAGAGVGGGQPPSSGGGGSSSSGGKGYVSGFSEILPKARAARAGDVGAAGEIEVAKAFRAQGENVHFQPAGVEGGPQRSAAGGTADLLVGGQRGTGVGGRPVDVFTPETANVSRILSAAAGKATQAPNVVVNLNYSRANPAALSGGLARANGMLSSWKVPERLQNLGILVKQTLRWNP